jgi:L-arabinokinase
MSRPVLRPPGFDSEDATAFVSEVANHPFFEPVADLVVARAPGRLDLMGGIADYSGSLVLQWPLREATLVAAQRTSDGHLRVTSLPGEGGTSRTADHAVEDLFPRDEPLDLESAKQLFKARPGEEWAAYVLGVLLVLAHARGLRKPAGLRLLIRSSVPEGKGVSSSAAVEVAATQALASLFDLSIAPRDLALLAQQVENRIVGAACGVMDQMTASCGEANRLLALLCQPAELRGTLALPDDLEVWGIDSGVRHTVSGSDYTSVRVGAFMGARILAARAGLRARPGALSGTVEVDDTRWRGHLANVTPSELEGGSLGALPAKLSGAYFLAAYEGIADTVTRVDPGREYAVRACAAHPVYEHFRVRAFAELLEAPPSERRNLLLGELMYQSHASYSSCGLGAEATDLIVALVRGTGPAHGFFGAKITGGGSGGTVAVLGRRGAPIHGIASDFEARTGHRPRIFSGSSSGSAAFGTIRLGPS